MQEAMQPYETIDRSLTPREARLQRSARALFYGAVITAGIVALAIVTGIIAAIIQAEPLFELLRTVLLFRSTADSDVALVSAILLLLISMSSLLITMVGVLAQEFWTLIVGLVFALASVGMLFVFGYLPAVVSLVFLGWATVIIIPDIRALRFNPVMLKELRERMRGARAFAVISVYLALMGAFMVLLFLTNAPLSGGIVSSVTGDLGRTLFAGVVGLQLLLIIFISPAFTAGAITGERERKTFDLLQITLLPRPSFVVGKLESAMVYIFLLLLAAIPLQSIAFLFGGISEIEVILAFVILAVTAITLGTVGLFFSTAADRTLSASVRAYSLALAMLVGIPVLGSFFISVLDSALTGVGTGLTGWSPIVEAATIYIGALLASLNPFTSALLSQQLLLSRQEVGFFNVTLSSNGGTIPVASPWLSFTIIYLTIAVVLIVLSIRRIRQSDF